MHPPVNIPVQPIAFTPQLPEYRHSYSYSRQAFQGLHDMQQRIPTLQSRSSGPELPVSPRHPSPPQQPLPVMRRRRRNELGFVPEDLFHMGRSDDGGYNDDDDDEDDDFEMNDVPPSPERRGRRDHSPRRQPHPPRRHNIVTPSPPRSADPISGVSSRHRRATNSRTLTAGNLSTKPHRRPSPVPTQRDEKGRKRSRSEKSEYMQAAECAHRVRQATERLDKVQRSLAKKNKAKII